MKRQKKYIDDNVVRVGFSFRKKYDYPLYKLFENIHSDYLANPHNSISRNQFVKQAILFDLKNDSEYECQIQNSNIHYEPFPKYYHYKNQFTVAFNWNTDQTICKKLLTISNDGENPTNYIRNAVYHYLTHVNIKL